MFLGRERQLGELREQWDRNELTCVAVYGRRRSGKTALLEEFSKDIPTIFFTASQEGREENLDRLRKAISDSPLSNDINLEGDIRNIFHSIFDASREKHFFFVIDEFSFLEKTYQGAQAVLKGCIDHCRIHKSSKLMLVLCGSSLSFMLEDLFPYHAPMYGRFDDKLRVNPFQLKEIIQILPEDMDSREILEYYAVTGGNPGYISMIDPSLDKTENFKRLFLRMSKEPPEFMIKQEVPDAEEYNNIVRGIANGKTRFNNLKQYTRYDPVKLEKMLARLGKLEIVEQQMPCHPIDGIDVMKNNPLLILKDLHFLFWHSCFEKYAETIRDGNLDEAMPEIMGKLPVYMGHAFEHIAKEALRRMPPSEKRPILDDLGRWWGRNPETGGQEEIDLVGNGYGEALFCECKYRTRPTNSTVIDELKRKAEMFDCGEDFKKHFYSFSANGFTDECMEKHPDVIYVDADVICGKKELLDLESRFNPLNMQW